jgi:hypothetical protein
MQPFSYALISIALTVSCMSQSPSSVHSAPVPRSSVPGSAIRIVLVGDSTVNNGGGWGPGFCALMTPNVECINQARNGRSSKSYYDEGLWQPALALHGDYYRDRVNE